MTPRRKSGYVAPVTELSAPPDFIGPYRVVRPVARGGMAAVYEVIEPDTGRHLALKLLERRFRGHHRFGREYRALTRLDHPNIVRVYRFGVSDNGTPFLTMELLDGVPAQVHAKRRGRPGTPERTREAVRIIGEVAKALSYLHSRGIVHRDLKSSNVLVLRDGRVKVLDFGTARLADAAEAITRHGEFVGTYAYAAPEQFNGSGVDARTDLYSLGVLFYRLLTGHRPFESDDPEVLRRLHNTEVPVDPCSRVPGIPAEVGAVVMHLLRKIPDERPHSASWVVSALERHSGDRPRAVELPEPDVAGRTDVILEVRTWLSDIPNAAGQTVILGGPVGVGAPRLLRQVQADAEGLGWTVVQAALSSVPGIRGLAGVVRAVCRWGGVRADPELGFVLAAVSRTPSPGAPTVETPDRLVRVLKRAFENRDGPTLLLLRGLDEAPDDVLAMLSSLVSCGASVALVGSVSVSSPSVLQRVTRAMPESRHEALVPLDYAACFRLVGAVLGIRCPPPRLVGRVFRATGGRPGFVVEVVHTMQSEGLAAADSSTSPVDLSGGKVPLPPSVAQAIRGQLRALSTRGLRILQVLALSGGPVGAAAIEDVTGMSAAETLLELEGLEASFLVRSIADGAAWELPLGLLGQVVRAGLRPTRRDVLVRRLAGRLAQSTPSAGLVRLLLESGQLAEASRAAVIWGRAELERGHPDLVAPVLGRIVRVWQGTDGQKGCPGPLLLLQAAARIDLEPGSLRTSEILDALRRRPDVPPAASALLLARHLRWRPSLARAEHQLDTAEQLARDTDDIQTLLGAGRLRAIHALAAGRFSDAHRTLDAAEHAARHRPDSGSLNQLAVVRARVLVAQGDAEAAIRVLDAAEAHRRWLGPRERETLVAARAGALGLQQRWADVVDSLLAPALGRVRESGDPIGHAALLVRAMQARIALFQLGEARDLLDESHAAGLRGLPWFRVLRARYDGILLEMSGSVTSAVATLRGASESAARFGMRVEEAKTRATLGRALMREGRLEEAIQVLDSATAIVSDLEAGAHQDEVALCRVEALLMPAARPSVPWRALVAEGRGLGRSSCPRVRARACVALLESNVLRSEERISVVVTARAALDELEACLSGEAKSAFQIHPWRVTVERAAQSGSGDTTPQ